MVMRVLLTYLTVELIAVIALAWALGPWWTIAIVGGSLLLGPLLVGSQVRRQLAGLGRAARRPDQAVTDGVLVGIGSTLVLVPGLVSTVLGGLMLASPTRGAMRPLAQALLARGVARRFAAVDLTVRSGAGDFIDGEVIDVDDVGPGARPNLPAVR